MAALPNTLGEYCTGVQAPANGISKIELRRILSRPIDLYLIYRKWEDKADSGEKNILTVERLARLGFEFGQTTGDECVRMIRSQGILQILRSQAKCVAGLVGLALRFQGATLGQVSVAGKT